MTAESAPDYDELAGALKRLNAGTSAADLHGSLCGYLCAGGRGVQQFLTAVSLEHLAADGVDAEARSVIGRLFRSSEQDLDDDSFGFEPILPAGDTPVSERAQALLQWCQGFLGGLGVGGFSDERKLSRDGREVLQDMAEIARSQLSFDEDEEVDESALSELLEFARMGALLLREDLRARQPLPKAGHA